MRAVDTNVLIRRITRDDSQQVASADRFVGKGVWVSTLALAETTWVLSAVYERSPADIAMAVEMLLSHRGLTVQDSNVVAKALTTFRTRPAVGFLDCLLLEVARKTGHVPLSTFDRASSKLDGAEKL